MKKIKENKIKLLNYIKDYLDDNGYFPTVREMMNFLGLKSTSTIQYYLDKLETEGKLKKGSGKNKARAFEFILADNPIIDKIDNYSDFTKIPLVGTITAGTPILAQENLEDIIGISNTMFSGENLFMLTVDGNSMIEAGIFNGDKIIVRKQNSAINGEIIVALLDNTATVKRFYKEKDRIRLQPENSTMSPIFTNNCVILGKVIGLIRKLK